LILAGEHAVVYGVPAVALGIDRGALAHAKELASGPCRLRVTTWSADVSERDGHELARAFHALLGSVRTDGALAPVEVEATTELPAGGGLGCSAALGVAIARAVAPDASDDDIREHAMAWERIFHGNPSGVDAAVATLGGAVQFVRQDERSVIETIAPLGSLVFAIGHSGIASSTRAMVESVARQRAERPAAVEATFDAVRAVVGGVRAALEAGDRVALGQLLDQNQAHLGTLALSTPSIELMCESAREAGALGAKLTGAGGGGCVVALADGRASAERILSAWKARSFEGFVAEIHTRGRAHAHDHAGSELAAT
jgi:mevalonate kinase